jgi:spermidine synthase
VALDKFTFLKEAPARVEVVTGDARISLEREAPHNFNLIVVDAFSGDSIPVHLLTREALGLYFRHLNPTGAIAFHVTNKHLELSPVVGMLAREYGAYASLIHNSKESSRGIYVSSWVIVTRNASLYKEIGWLSSPIPYNGRLRLWTDDYSNLFAIIR